MLIHVSDLDEVPRPETLELAKRYAAAGGEFLYLLQQWHSYSFNYVLSSPKPETQWGVPAKEGPYIATLSMINRTGMTPSDLRRHLRSIAYSNPPLLLPNLLPSSGWHLSSFGGPAAVKAKMATTCCDPSTYTGFSSEDVEGLTASGVPYYAPETRAMKVEDGHGIGLPSPVVNCR